MKHFVTTLKATRGNSLGMVLIFTGVLLILTVAIFDFTQMNTALASRRVKEQDAIRIAEAGIEKVVWCLNNLDSCTGGGAYSGESNTPMGNGTFTTEWDSGTRTVISTGAVGNVSKQLKVTLTTSITDVAFHYGVQVGEGGLKMDNGSYINGNVYSNGSIIGDTDSGVHPRILGTATAAGGTSLTPDQTQTIITSDFNLGYPTSATSDGAQSFKPSATNFVNKAKIYVKKVSTPGNATVRIVNDAGGKPGPSALAIGTLDRNAVTNNYGWVEIAFTTNPSLIKDAVYWLVLDTSDSTTKYYVWGKHDNSGYGNGIGMYSDDWNNSDGGSWLDANGDFTFEIYMGGIATKISKITIPNTVSGAYGMANTVEDSIITGTIECQTLSSGTITGNVSCGAISSSTITGNVTTKTIANSTITGDLTCESYSATTVSGTTNCPTPPFTPPSDPPLEQMPISPSNIEQWKLEAAEGVPVISGNYTVSGNTSLGPKEITGNLSFGSNNLTLTVTGTLYIHGTLSISNGSTIQCDPTFGAKSCIIVTDGYIDISNNATYRGSGTAGSYVMLVSTNGCGVSTFMGCATGTSAIYVKNNAVGVIFYAANGLIYLAQNVGLTEATGFKMKIENNAFINYEQGLQNAKFASGPGASWAYQKGTYQIL